MSKRFKHKERVKWERADRQQAFVPKRLLRSPSAKLINVFVEGYEDVAFWRGIFDHYESNKITFEVSVPPREDLAKGKKVLMTMIPNSSHNLLLCVDSDFDYLFAEMTQQSRELNTAPYMFHTYAYSTENYLCYAPSLHNICVKATKNDTRIFDFERFMLEYSRRIYPLFLWYTISARTDTENIFPLIDFRSSVRLNYLEVENNGAGTLDWLERQVKKRLHTLSVHNPQIVARLKEFEHVLTKRGVTPDNVYLFMQGHTLLENVVMVMLNSVCDELKKLSNSRIAASTKQGIALKNELSNYNNSQRNVRDILLDNENYKECFLYQNLKSDIERYIEDVMSR